MTLCVEAYIGAEGGREGVKLEEQVVITQHGAEPYPAILMKMRCWDKGELWSASGFAHSRYAAGCALLGVINAIADHKFIRNIKTCPAHIHLYHAGRLVQQGTDRQAFSACGSA